ncbi:MAG: DUF4332 domain-containing protein [Anaerolineales bacterium]|nr:DUF4332 domain-containing protein [Anaerolineales bacterium]
MVRPLSELKMISPENLKKLEDQGITTQEQLFEMAAHTNGRQELSKKTGIPENLLQAWVIEADNQTLLGGMKFG